jgi:hypothetical protein
MPAGQAWTFRHWIYSNTAYIDNYVERTDSVVSTVYIDQHFEQVLAGGATRKYYFLGGKRIAEDSGSTLYFISGDQLGSLSLTTNSGGGAIAQDRYPPFGGTRWESGATPTEFKFTDQRQEPSLGAL